MFRGCQFLQNLYYTFEYKGYLKLKDEASKKQAEKTEENALLVKEIKGDGTYVGSRKP